MDALSMITKAGAPSDKVVVGVASDGRSFKMEQTGCDLENCKFTGDNCTSNAAPGRCTGTSGYISNAEIKESIATAGSTGSGRLRDLTFWSITIRSGWRIWATRGRQLDPTSTICTGLRAPRTGLLTCRISGGKSDNTTFQNTCFFFFSFAFPRYLMLTDATRSGNGYEDIDESEYIDENYWAPCPCIFTTLAQLEKRKGSVPAHCVEQYLLDIQIAVFEGALKKYKELLSNDYDGKFKTYEKSAEAQVPD
jgi:hypothetical protein